MVAYNKFDNAVDNLCKANINFGSDVFKVMLTNTAPVRTNSAYSDISANELGAGNGYPTGGSVCTISLGNVSGVETCTGSDVTFTASGGSIGPFRYAVLYDATTGKLWAWFDYGSAITLADGSQFVFEPNNATPSGTLFTMS